MANRIIFILLIVPGCATSIPKWDGYLWIGDKDLGALTRVDAENVRHKRTCFDEKFDSMVCMSIDDYKSFMNSYVYSCSEWDMHSVFFPKGSAQEKQILEPVKAPE